MGTVAIAVLLRKEREIVAAFRAAGAAAPDAAVTLTALGVHDGVALRRLRQRAIIREAGTDRFYLDEPSYVANVQIRRRLALVVVIIGILLLGFAGILATLRVP